MVMIIDGPPARLLGIRNNCPFCDKQPSKERRGGGTRKFVKQPTECRVACVNLLCHVRPATQWYHDENVAVEAWDTRPAPKVTTS